MGEPPRSPLLGSKVAAFVAIASGVLLALAVIASAPDHRVEVSHFP